MCKINITDDVALVTIKNLSGNAKFIPEIFEKISNENINLNFLFVPPPHRGEMDIIFTVDMEDVMKIVSIMAVFKKMAPELSCDLNLNNAKIFFPKKDMDILKNLVKLNIDIKLINICDAGISFLINESDTDFVIDYLNNTKSAGI